MVVAPVVERVRPGVWSLPVPIPDSPLGYTLVYLIDSDRGPVIVDAGWDDPATLAALEAGFVTAGFSIGDCYGVLVTHQHPDHHGLSGKVRDASGAWVAMHADDAEVVTHRRDTAEAWFFQTAAVMLAAGASEVELAALPAPGDAAPPPSPALPNRLLADGELADVPGWKVRVVWTPGHTPGHVCFLLEDQRLFLSGDHVLPRITPHVGLYRDDDESDPLGQYVDSLERLRDVDVDEVLPAHEHRFPDLHGRVREIADHHDARIAQVRGLVADSVTAWDVAERMEWNRPWDAIPASMKRAALGEALAHLRYLERRGEIRVDTTTKPVRYEPTR